MASDKPNVDSEGKPNPLTTGSRPSEYGEPSVGGTTMISAPTRLASLRPSDLLGTEIDPAFDRLTKLAASVLRAPVSLFSLIEQDRAIIASSFGLEAYPANLRNTLLSHSCCRYLVEEGEPLMVVDAREQPVAEGNPSTVESDVIAYLGVPLITSENHVLGGFCVMDFEPRQWSEADLSILQDLAASVVTEIELRAATAEAHRERVARQALLDSSSEGIFGMDAEARCTYINQAAVDLLGYTAEECLGRNMHELTHYKRPDGSPYPMEECPIYQGFTSGKGARLIEETLWHKDGSPLQALYSCSPIFENEQVVGAVVTIIDIRERKIAEDKLREEARIIESLYNISGTLISELDSKQNIQAVTDAATELTGAEFGAFFMNATDDNGDEHPLYTVSGASKADFKSFSKPRNTALLSKTFFGDATVRLDDVTTDPRYGKNAPHLGMPVGHLPIRSYLAVPVISRGGQVIGGFFLGHSEPGVFNERAERLAESVAAQAAIVIDNSRLYAASQRAVRAREEFLSIASHELRTPLTTIKGYVQLLNRALSSPQVDLNRLMATGDSLMTQVERLETLATDLLDVSQLQQGRIELRPEHIDLAELARQVALRFEEAIDRLPTHSLVLDAPEPVWGYWDPSRLDQVLTNLLSNALKYSPDGGEIRIRVYRQGDRAEIQVSDQGIGISQEDQLHLFQPFARGESARDEVRGTGLGLYITRRLVRRHGGRILVASQPGAGTTFIVRLPCE